MNKFDDAIAKKKKEALDGVLEDLYKTEFQNVRKKNNQEIRHLRDTVMGKLDIAETELQAGLGSFKK